MNEEISGPINLGNPTEMTIIELASKIISKINPELNIIYKDMPIIILKDWHSININKLIEESKTIITKSREKLFLKYWINQIKQYK